MIPRPVGLPPQDPTVVPDTRPGLLENVASGQCLNTSGYLTTCTRGSGLGWIAQTGSQNGFTIVDASGSCLEGWGAGGVLAVSGCGSGTGALWKITARTSRGGTVENVENAGRCLASGPGGPGIRWCDVSDPEQLWFDDGPA